jgi:hypothetical protein
VIKQQEKYIEISNKLKIEHKFLTPKLVGKWVSSLLLLCLCIWALHTITDDQLFLFSPYIYGF